MNDNRDEGIFRNKGGSHREWDDSLIEAIGRQISEGDLDAAKRQTWEDNWDAELRRTRDAENPNQVRGMGFMGNQETGNSHDWMNSDRGNRADWMGNPDRGQRLAWETENGNAGQGQSWYGKTGDGSEDLHPGQWNADSDLDGGAGALPDMMAASQKKSPVKKKRKRRKKRYLLKFTLACLTVAAGYYFINSSFFDVQSIEVENNVYYTSMQIIEKSGVGAGTNIFRMDLGELKRSLLADPYIVSAKAKRVLPSKVVIDVSERREAAFIRDGNYVIIIDENGLVLRRSEVEPILPELSNINIVAAEEGGALNVEQNAAFSDALSLMKGAAEGGLYFKKIDISNVVVRAYVYDHLICEGTPDNLIKNMKSMKSVLEQLDQQGIQRGTVKVSGDRYIAWQPAEEI